VLLSAGLIAAALIFTVVTRRAPPPIPPLPRPGSTEVVAFLPVGEVKRVSEFRWASPVAASRYLVVVHGGGTAELLRREITEQVLKIDKDLAGRFRPGQYNWTVEAVGEDGRVVAQSKVETFILR
jgi:hypothetical protein